MAQRDSEPHRTRLHSTDNFQFHEENQMYVQAAIRPKPLLRNVVHSIIMRGVQKVYFFARQ